VKYLKSVGADINVKRNDGETPLYSASWNGQLEVVKYLKSVGADINAKDNVGNTPLH
jgi:ankyrin repeat protein